MRCIVCDSTSWKNADAYRIKPQGMSVCRSCGFVSYPDKYKTKDQIREYYRDDYRKPPTVQNSFTGERKIWFHSKFLQPVFERWDKAELKNPVIGEVGSAYGMFLNWIRGLYPEAEIYGTEWTKSFKRNAWHEFQVRLDDELDFTKKYDLIASYKVAEHQMDVDKDLEKYAQALTETGVLYISVPIWFDAMSNFGVDGWDIEYYYHPDHINVWSLVHFQSLLAKAGLRVVEQDNQIYDYTFLCVRDDREKTKTFTFPSMDETLGKMARIQKADNMFHDNDCQGAIKEWPNFPIAYRKHFEMNRAQITKQDWKVIRENLIDPAISATNEHFIVLSLAADIAMRKGEWHDAIKILDRGLEIRPNNPGFMMNIHHCIVNLAEMQTDGQKKTELYQKAQECARALRSVSMQMRNEAINWLYSDNARIPTPFEEGEKNGN